MTGHRIFDNDWRNERRLQFHYKKREMGPWDHFTQLLCSAHDLYTHTVHRSASLSSACRVTELRVLWAYTEAGAAFLVAFRPNS